MKGTYCCPHKTAEDLHPDLILKISELEKRLGKEIWATRGVECQECNKLSGGKDLSAHVPENNESLKGEAIDFTVISETVFKVVEFLFAIGFTGIGIKRKSGESGFVHGDIAKTNTKRPRPCLWTY